jgi:hypothetical protein
LYYFANQKDEYFFFAMNKQEPIKRTLITTALAFSLSILSWYIHNNNTEERLMKESEQANAHPKEVSSPISIRN